MDPNWGDYWARSRKMGRLQFVLKRGTALGLIMFALMILIPRFFSMVENTDMPIMAFIIFMLIGFAFATLLWWANERSYQKLLASKTLNAQENQSKSDDD